MNRGKETINQGDIAIIADDLTGACDCAVEFVGVSTVSVEVLNEPQAIRPEAPSDGPASAARSAAMLVINTQSRDIAPQRAAAAARDAARRARKSGARIIVKKTDSAFRGNYAAELLAVIAELKPARVVIAHAIPDFGRTTVNGVQLIDGVPADRSFYAEDPMHRSPGSRPADLLAESTLPITGISLEALRSGSPEQESHSGGTRDASRIFVVDGETNDDLDRTAERFLAPAHPTGSAQAHPAPLLFVGGQGIAAALARRVRPRSGVPSRAGSVAEGLQPLASETGRALHSGRGGGVLVVAGSRHPATLRQVSRLSVRLGVTPGTVAPGPGDGPEVELSDDIASHGIAIQLVTAEPAQPETLERSMAEVCERVVRRTRVSGIFLTGGNTALAVLRTLGIARIEILGKVGTGTVVGRPVSGSFGVTPPPLLCIKGGSLGEDDVMERFLRLCRPPDGGES